MSYETHMHVNEKLLGTNWLSLHSFKVNEAGTNLASHVPFPTIEQVGVIK